MPLGAMMKVCGCVGADEDEAHTTWKASRRTKVCLGGEIEQQCPAKDLWERIGQVVKCAAERRMNSTNVLPKSSAVGYVHTSICVKQEVFDSRPTILASYFEHLASSASSYSFPSNPAVAFWVQYRGAY